VPAVEPEDAPPAAVVVVASVVDGPAVEVGSAVEVVDSSEPLHPATRPMMPRPDAARAIDRWRRGSVRLTVLS